MGHIFQLIRDEGIRSLVRRIVTSVKRRAGIKVEFKKNIRWNDRKLAVKAGEVFEDDVKFSIIVPVFNTPSEYLIQMIESCIWQTYSGWELCIADASDDKHSYVGDIIRGCRAGDSRILYKKLSENGGISENTNRAMELAGGDYYVMLDHDDMLHPLALYYAMKEIVKSHPDYIYTDELVFEDKISNVKGIYHKPDYSPEALRGSNYICHLSIYSEKLCNEAGRYRKEYDGSQDYDMILRLTEKAAVIAHIPEVLYFWRSHDGSVARGVSAKMYAVDAGKKAIESHLERLGRKGTVACDERYPTVYDVSYDIQGEHGVLLMIWGTVRNPVTGGKMCELNANTDYDDYEIYAGGSFTGADDICGIMGKTAPRCTIDEQSETLREFVARGLNAADKKYVMIMNGMAQAVSKDWLGRLVMHAQWDEIGAVGGRTLSDTDTVHDCGVYVMEDKKHNKCDNNIYRIGYNNRGMHRGNCGYMMRNLFVQNIDIPSVNFVLADRNKIAALCGNAESGSVTPDYSEDGDRFMIDLCRGLAESGYRNVWTPFSEMIVAE